MLVEAELPPGIALLGPLGKALLNASHQFVRATIQALAEVVLEESLQGSGGIGRVLLTVRAQAVLESRKALQQGLSGILDPGKGLL